jgi:hypothetical protein
MFTAYENRAHSTPSNLAELMVTLCIFYTRFIYQYVFGRTNQDTFSGALKAEGSPYLSFVGIDK